MWVELNWLALLLHVVLAGVIYSAAFSWWLDWEGRGKKASFTCLAPQCFSTLPLPVASTATSG